MRRLTTFAAIAFTAYAPFAAALDQNNAAPPVPAGNYELDKAHSSLIFRVSHMTFSHFTARFTRFDAQLAFDPARLASSRVSVNVDPRSIESDNAPAGFLDELAGKDWLNAGDFPELSFRSKSIAVTGPNTFRITGDLTLHGTTKPVVLDASYNGGYAGLSVDPHARVGFSAHGKFKRSDFGVTVGIPAPGSIFGVGDEVDVAIESEFNGPPLQTSKN
jgi:polyisoprenoid-binding protein YceI